MLWIMCSIYSQRSTKFEKKSLLEQPCQWKFFLSISGFLWSKTIPKIPTSYLVILTETLWLLSDGQPFITAWTSPKCSIMKSLRQPDLVLLLSKMFFIDWPSITDGTSILARSMNVGARSMFKTISWKTI